jgi:hypothetical protein
MVQRTREVVEEGIIWLEPELYTILAMEEDGAGIGWGLMEEKEED